MRKGLIWFLLLSLPVHAQSVSERLGFLLGTIVGLLVPLGGALEEIAADPVKFVIAVKLGFLVLGGVIIYSSRFPKPLRHVAFSLLLFTLVSVRADFLLTATGVLRIIVQSAFLALAGFGIIRGFKLVQGRSRAVQIPVLLGLLFVLFQLYSVWKSELSGVLSFAFQGMLILAAIGLGILMILAVSRFLPANLEVRVLSAERDVLSVIRRKMMRLNLKKLADKRLADAAKKAAADASSAAQNVQKSAGEAAAELALVSNEVKESEEFITRIDELLKGDAKNAFAFFVENYAKISAPNKIMLLSKGDEFVKNVVLLKSLAAAEEEKVFGLFSDVKNGIVHFESFAAELAGYISTIEENELACARLEKEISGLPFSSEERANLLALLLPVKTELESHKVELQKEQKELDGLLRSLADVRAERKKVSEAYRALSGIPVRESEMRQWFGLIFDKAKSLEDISHIVAPMKVDFELMVKFVSQIEEFKKVVENSTKFFSEKISALLKLTASVDNSKSAVILERVAGPVAQVSSRCDAVRQYVDFKKKEASFQRLFEESNKRIDTAVSNLQKRAQSVLSSGAKLSETVFVAPEQAAPLLSSVSSLIDFYDFSSRQLAFMGSEFKKGRDFLGKVLAFKQSLKEDASQTQALLSQLDAKERKIKETLVHLISEAPEAKRHAELLKSLLSQLSSQDAAIKQAAQQKFSAEGQQLLNFVKASLAELSSILSKPF